jgi:two-component system sensor histidine kinase UhpB
MSEMRNPEHLDGAAGGSGEPKAYDRFASRLQRADEELPRVRGRTRSYLDVEEAPRESEERFNHLVETATDAIILLDERTCVLSWNMAAAKLFGYAEEDALGKQLHSLLGAGGDCALVEEILDAGRGSATCKRIELVPPRKDGSQAPVEVSISRFRLGGIERLVVFARDLIERKAVEQEIIDSKARLEFILKSCRAAVYTARPFGTYQSTYKSESIKDITGYEPSDFTEIPDFWLSHIHPEDADYAIDEVERIFKKGQHEYEYRFLHRDGTYRWIRDEMRLVRDEDGNPKEIVGSLSDVTELRNAREQIEASREQLRLLAARIESVREQERKKIAREIHDEFGQALTGLKLDLRWLEKHIPLEEREVKNRVCSMLEVIDSNIELVRTMSSRLRPWVLDDLGLAAAVEWHLDVFRKMTGIECILSSTLQEVKYDDETTTALFRILQEALTNVARHSDATRVEVETGESEGNLLLEVRDNGRGIKRMELKDAGSLGILSMRERALNLGGEVVIEGVRGAGTTVKVKVPIMAEEPA